VKLGANGVFEGPELRSKWLDSGTNILPEFTKGKIEFPELVMVRPGQAELSMSEILQLFQNETRNLDLDSWISAYIEYTPMSSNFAELKTDVPESELFRELKLKHQNIWIGDGQTLGKMHFDEFENSLVMIKGKKQFIIYEPHKNYKLYEGHIPEARLNAVNKGYLKYDLERTGLLESTSLVMSPVDILEPNFELFPNFKDAVPMNCTVNEGEMLFLPSFWWHEVQSYPAESEPLNIAVNFWYEPFFKKEFPCQACPLKVNPEYFNIL
jgi:jumonji domain-containing protein 7